MFISSTPAANMTGNTRPMAASCFTRPLEATSSVSQTVSNPVSAAPTICTGPETAPVRSQTTTMPNTTEWRMASVSMLFPRSTRKVPISEAAIPTSEPVVTISRSMLLRKLSIMSVRSASQVSAGAFRCTSSGRRKRPVGSFAGHVVYRSDRSAAFEAAKHPAGAQSEVRVQHALFNRIIRVIVLVGKFKHRGEQLPAAQIARLTGPCDPGPDDAPGRGEQDRQRSDRTYGQYDKRSG